MVSLLVVFIVVRGGGYLVLIFELNRFLLAIDVEITKEKHDRVDGSSRSVSSRSVD